MFFVVDPDKEVSPRHSSILWQRLWEMRDFAPISAVLPATVSSSCPLLPDEEVRGLQLATLLQVPDNSAWATLEIDLVDFTRPDGSLQQKSLDAALRAAVKEGEHRHDNTGWSTPAMRYDSWLNRRLSVLVHGWGDLVSLRQHDPADISTLRDMQLLAEHVAAVLQDESRTIARREGYCPALDVAGARVLQHGTEMNARWRRAVGEHAVRHRNLLTLSPWGIFPRRERADCSYFDLLPILACANSVSFCRDVDICHWNVTEFRSFYHRISAILRRSGDLPLIAKQV